MDLSAATLLELPSFLTRFFSLDWWAASSSIMWDRRQSNYIEQNRIDYDYDYDYSYFYAMILLDDGLMNRAVLDSPMILPTSLNTRSD